MYRFRSTVRALARRYLKQHGHLAEGVDAEGVVDVVFLALARDEFRLLRWYDGTCRLQVYVAVVTRTEVDRLVRERRRSPL